MKETPSQLPFPSFVMNFPFSFSTENPNNIWMQEMSSEELKVNRGKAYKQFMDLYNFVSGAGFVCNLPSHGNKFQDLVYVANMGIYLPHCMDFSNLDAHILLPKKQHRLYIRTLTLPFQNPT